MCIRDRGRREEIDYEAPGSAGGRNYGWDRMEGSLCYEPTTGCNDGTLTMPVIEYAHDSLGGCSVTGGYRHRGGLAGLQHLYLYGDYCSGRVWYTGMAFEPHELLRTSNIATFGESARGDLYLGLFDPERSVAQLVPTSAQRTVDMDGDERTDLVVNTGSLWYVARSGDGTVEFVDTNHQGTPVVVVWPDGVPRVTNYDPSTGVWRSTNSSFCLLYTSDAAAKA